MSNKLFELAIQRSLFGIEFEERASDNHPLIQITYDSTNGHEPHSGTFSYAYLQELIDLLTLAKKLCEEHNASN